MAHQIDEVRREINIQIEKLRKDTTEENPCTFTLRTFDSQVRNVVVNIDQVPVISGYNAIDLKTQCLTD